MTPHSVHTLPMVGGPLVLGPVPLIMGIVNVTPDSFSDGGDFALTEPAVAQAVALVEAGADIVDIGGESTRPGSQDVSTQDELDRIMPVLDALRDRNLSAPISIDSYKAVVADQAMQAGARIINDVHGLQREPEIADVAALYGAPVVAMHWDTARDTGKDLIAEMARYFEATLKIADKAGVQRGSLILDPGFGFSKSFEENYQLLRRLPELLALGFPLLIGTSRKRMFGKLLGVAPKKRDVATAASSVIAYEAGSHIFRVHDVAMTRDALRVAVATRYGPPPPIEDEV